MVAPQEIVVSPSRFWKARDFRDLPPPKPFRVRLDPAIIHIWAGEVCEPGHAFDGQIVYLSQRKAGWDGEINVEISPRTPKDYASGWARLASRPPGPGAEGEPSCRPVDGTAPFDKLLALWAQPEHDYPRRVSHGAAEVASLAAHYGVRLPDDFRDYLIHACSTVDDGGNMDAFTNGWWGLERIRSVTEECGEKADVVLGDGSAKTLLFADTLIWCSAWGICCEEGPDFGRIFLAIDSCCFVADSFTEFVDRYLKDDITLY